MAAGNFLYVGGIKVSLQGRNIERFFNISAQRELVIKDISTNADGLVTFWTTSGDFKQMKPVAKKSGVRLRICSRYGIPFFLYRNRKRKLLVGGLVSFFLILYGMSFFIWNISFVGNHRFTDEMLLHYMESIPVVHGMKKSEVSCDELEAGIRNQFTEITWVSAEIAGTRLIVHVKENEAMLAPEISEDVACDLAANKGGIVVRTVVRNGVCHVREGDEVEADTLLVSGAIPIFDDSQILVNSHEVHADAEIYAQTVHTIQKSVPFTETVKSRTGVERTGIFFKLFDSTFYLISSTQKESNWEYVMEQTQMRMFDNFYLPIYIGTLKAYEYLSYEKNFTEEEITSISNVYLQEYVEKLAEKGIQILGCDGKIEQGESGWQIQGTLTVIEDIAKEVPINGQMKDEE